VSLVVPLHLWVWRGFARANSDRYANSDHTASVVQSPSAYADSYSYAYAYPYSDSDTFAFARSGIESEYVSGATGHK
jgi:hypothetical protein